MTTSARRFTVINEPFVCQVCQESVKPLTTGCRNHCPTCLHSLHLDIHPGDRLAHCGGIMKPISIEHNSKKGYMVVHRCDHCGYQTVNKLALDDPVQPDSMETVLRIMRNRAKT
nr:RNHCP domain-containing protein [Bacilli bacterium]